MKLKMLLIYFRSEQFYSIMNPLSIEALSGHLKGVFKDELQLDLIDIHNYSELPFITKAIEQNSYNIIGFSIMSYTSDIFFEAVKRNCFDESLVVLGNQLATYAPQFLLKGAVETGNIRYDRILSIKGEGEATLELIIKKIQKSPNNKQMIEMNAIPNIVYFENKENLIETSEEAPNLKLMRYPPDYMYTKNSFIQMQLSRGCYWGNCIFCTRKSFRMGKHWESFPLDRIRLDLEKVILHTDANIIEFCDDEFFGGNSDEHLKRCYDIIDIINALSSKTTKKLKFRLFTRPDFIYTENDEERNEKVKVLLQKLKQVGLSRIYIGIESGSTTQLKRYNRGLSKNTIEQALKTLESLNIKYDGGFIMFDKGLNLTEMKETIDFYRKINLIESNQWIWRPMIANLGSSIGEQLKDCDCSKNKLNYDTMEVNYEYDDKIIHHIQKIIDLKSAETRELFYALKVISKEDYDYTDENVFNSIAHKLVMENGLIYVNFLYELVSLLEKTDQRILSLVEACTKECDRGVFSDEDEKTLRFFLKQIRNKSSRGKDNV